jgi:hypothetical protein
LTTQNTSHGSQAASDFRPAPALRGPHFQTILANGPFSRCPVVELQRERIELPDGDFLDLDWLVQDDDPADAPIVFLLHGLTGSAQSRYAQDLFTRIRSKGWRAVLMNFRGCSGHPNRLPRTYHAGETTDFEYILRLLQQREPGRPIAAVGYSLGGNVLLKHLGAMQSQSPLSAGVAVSVPFDLEIAARSLGSGLSRIYQINLLQQLRKSILAKYQHGGSPFDWERAMSARDFFEFDDAVTAPLHGFDGVSDYYSRSSSRQYLGAITVPTLILHAEDDPFVHRSAIPSARELGKSVTLELSRHGGHVGFLQGFPGKTRNRWLPQRIIAHLAGIFAAS